MGDLVSNFISILSWVLYGALMARIFLSWVSPSTDNPFVAVVYQITEPILAPLRKLLPTFGTLDFSPMAAILLIVVIQSLLT